MRKTAIIWLALLAAGVVWLSAQITSGGGGGMGTVQGSIYTKVPNPSQAVFDGDSLSAGIGLAKSADNTASCRINPTDATCLDWPSQLQTMSSMSGRVVKNNFAISGNTIAQVQARYTASVHPLAPAAGATSYLFFYAGSNDMASVNVAATETALTTYWAGAKADNFTLVAFTIPRRGDANGKVIGADTTRATVNSWIRAQLSAKLYDILIDVDRLLPTPFDSLIYQSDAIHPNAAGHYLLARAINSILLTDGQPTATGIDSVVGTGTENVRCNPMALYGITSGIQNTACGWRAGEAITTGQKNTFMGYLAGTSQIGLSNNTAIGWGALFTNTSGSDNVAIGNGAAVSSTSHSQNVIIGSFAGNNASAGGVGNVTIGYSAGQLVSTNGNVVIGYTAGAADAMAGNGIAIGNAARSTAAGAVQLGTGNNATANSLQLQSVKIADSTGAIFGATYNTATNCASSAGTCGSAAAGSVTVAAAATAVVVATTAVTASSVIIITYDSSLGTKLSVTCNVTEPALYGVTARSTGVSFTITSSAPITNPACFNYLIIN